MLIRYFCKSNRKKMIENYTRHAGNQPPATPERESFRSDPGLLPTHLTRFVLTVAFLILGLLPALAQVNVSSSGGTTTGTYATVNAAFTAINAGTHTGAITVTVTANTTEPATPVPLLASGTASSSYTGITIKPGSSGIVINGNASPTTGRAILELQGADNVTIDGSSNGTTSKDLTIQLPSSTTASLACIRLSSNSTTGADGANNNTVKNCIIIGSRSSSTSTVANYGIVFSNAAAAITTSTGAYSSLNTIISNNTITRCYYGIYAQGTSTTYPNTGLQITGNTLGTPVSGTFADDTTIGNRGIFLSYTAATTGGAIVSGNDIRAGVSATGYSASVAGIEVGNVNYGITIDRNNIHDISQPSTSGYGAHGIYVSSATNNTLSTITNNFIRNCTMITYQTSSSSTFIPTGVYFGAAATGIKFVHNTILMPAQPGGSNYSSFCVDAGISGVTFTHFLNNILVNNHTSTYAFGLYATATTSISAGTVNNNDYYVPGGHVGYYNSGNRSTLAAWQTATTKDANSLNVLPVFTSSTDLHLTPSGNGVLESGGASVATTGVSTDYDGNARPGPTGSVNGGGTAPDIGADEFDGILALPCTGPSAATAVTVGTITTTTIPGTITAPATAPTGYLVVYSTSASLSATPVDGTTYSAGNSLGGGTVGYVGSGTSFSLSSLVSNTQYYIFVYSYNSGTCIGGPKYGTALNSSAITCAVAPTAPAVTNIVANGATVSWTASAAGGSYAAITYTIRLYSDSGYTNGVSSYPNVTSSYAITGLTPNTLYYYQITASNGSCSSSINGGSFTTACTPASLTLTQGFNSAAIPSCWTTALANTTQTATKISYVTTGSYPTTTPNEGSNMVLYNSFSNSGGVAGSEERLISAPFTTTGINSVDINFDWRNENNTSYNANAYLNEGVQLQYSYDKVTWVNIGSLYARHDASITAGAAQWKAKLLTSTAFANQSIVYIAFKFHSEYGDNMFLDNVSITATPACPFPTAVTASAVTNATATLSWTAPTSAPANGYEYYYSASSTTPAAGVTVSGTTAAGVVTANISSLTPTTTYYAWVRSVCSTSSKSDWSSVASFTTLCDPVVSLPWTDGFESLTATGENTVPSCWKNETGTYAWIASNAATYTQNDPRTGTYYQTIRYSNSTASYLWSPGFSLTAGISYDFSFYFVGDGYSGWTGDVVYNTAQGSSGATTMGASFITSSTTSTTSYAPVTRSFVPTTSGIYYFAVKVSSNFSPYYLGVDDFMVRKTPTCYPPTALTVSSITNTGAAISWTAPTQGTPATYEYEVRSSGAAGSGSTGLVASGNTTAPTVSTSVGGLTQGQTYSLYLRSNCGSSDVSDWTVATTFTTQYVTPVTWTEGFTTTTLPNGWTNPAPAWSIGTLTQLGTGTGNYIYRQLNGTNTTAAFTTINVGPLDANDRLKFVYKIVENASPYSPAAAGSGNFVVEVSTNFGQTWTALETVNNSGLAGWQVKAYSLAAYSGQIVKVRITGNRTTGNMQYGFDSFVIEPTPACDAPLSLSATATGSSTATVTWPASGSNPTEGYQYYIATTSTAPTSATTESGSVAAGVTTALLTSLTPATQHYVWVRSNCDGTFSDWSSSATFTTMKLEPTNHATNFAVSAATTTAITTTWTAATGTVLPDGYSLRANTTSPAAPVDGTDTADATLAALPASRKIAGATTATGQLTAGTAGTMYYINNYTYTNSGTYIDFKTDGTVPSLNYATKPAAASAITLSETSSTTATVNWTLPTAFDPAKHTVLVFVKQGSAITVGTPTFGPGAYTASANFGTPGTAYQGDAAAYTVYKGTGTSVSITGLTTSTAYYIGVSIVMNDANYDSTYSVSASTTTNFTTPCEPTPFPWTENFDSSASMPGCWSIQSGTDWAVINNSASTYDADARSGSNFLRESWSATNEFVWSPGFALTAGTTYRFSFHWAGDTYAGWTGDVMYNTMQSATGNTQIGSSFVTPGTTTTKTYQQVNSDFTPTTSGTYYFAIRVNATSTPYYLSFDDFSFDLAPSCLAPQTITGTPTATTTATLSWTASPSNPASGYEYYYSTSATAPTDTTTPSGNVAAGVTTVNLTSLTANTTYYIWVRSVCGGTTMPTSSWTGSSFYLGYCIPSSYPEEYDYWDDYYYNYYISNFSTTGGSPNINSASTYASSGYSNYSSTQSVTSYPGSTINFNATLAVDYTSGFSIWVDWNNDLTFSSAERVYTTNAYVASASGSFIIPADATVGNHRMRIQVNDATNSPSDPCATAFYGETEDYTLTVVEYCTSSVSSVTGNSRCGAGTVSLTATGSTGTTQLRLYAAASGGTVLATSYSTDANFGTLTTPSISSTTTYYVAAYNGTCESNTRTAVTATVNAVPTAITITPSATTLCNGTVATLTATGGTVNATATASSGTVSLAIPDNSATGISQALAVSGIPTGATISKVDVTFSLNHAWLQDAEVVLLAPNGKYIALAADQGPIGTGSYVNTVITSDNTAAALSTSAATITGTYRANATVAGNLKGSFGTNLTSTFSDLFTVANGNWTVIAYDDASGDTGTLTSAAITITYNYNTPAVWSPVTGLFTDAAATTAYTGTPMATVYAAPTTNTTYTASINLSTGCSASNTVSITSAAASAPSTSSQQFCPGATVANLTATGTNIQWYTTSTNGTALSTSTALESGTYYASQTVNGCESTRTASVVTILTSWTGAVDSNWTTAGNWCGNTVPTSSVDVLIPAVTTLPVITSGINAYAHNLTVAENATLTVVTGATLSVDNILSVHPTATLTVQDNAALLQGSSTVTNINSGKIAFAKKSSNLYRLDYTLWSSPVANQNLGTFSPATTATRFYTYNPVTDQYAGAASATTSFAEATAYLIRMPNADTATGYNTGESAIQFTGNFNGEPHNGTVSRTLSTAGGGYNGVGNPYPSPINVADFFAANNGIIDGSGIYFWRKKNDGQSSSYATLTLAAFTANQAVGGGSGNAQYYEYDPVTGSNNWLLAPGQGFIVKTVATTGSPTLTFTNAMRRPTPGTSQSFFRTAANTASRLWVNMTAANGSRSQTAVAYMNNATMGIDYGYDGVKFAENNTLTFYSLAQNTALTVQARPEFVNTDVVPMGYFAPTAGSHTIAIDHVDGIFNQGQTIYLRDNLNGMIANLSNGSYTFITEAGTFEDRFDILYNTEALGTDVPTIDANNVVVVKQGTTITVNSGSVIMTGITIYDTRGRKVYGMSDINNTQTAINNLTAEQQVLIVEINTVKGKVSKRIIF